MDFESGCPKTLPFVWKVVNKNDALDGKIVLDTVVVIVYTLPMKTNISQDLTEMDQAELLNYYISKGCTKRYAEMMWNKIREGRCDDCNKLYNSEYHIGKSCFNGPFE